MLKTLGRIAFVFTALFTCELAAAVLAYAGQLALVLHPDMAPIGWGFLVTAALVAFVVPFLVIEGTR